MSDYRPGRAGAFGWGCHGSVFRTGNFYPSVGSGSGINLANNLLYAVPMPVDTAGAFDALAVNVSTVGSGATLRGGIYRDNGQAYPGQLVLEFGTQAVSALGQLLIVAGSVLRLAPSLYHLALVSFATTTVPAVTGGNLDLGRPIFGALAGGAGGNQAGWSAAGVSGALPAQFPAGAAVVSGSAPLVQLRAA